MINKISIADILVNFNSFFVYFHGKFIYDNSDMQKKGGTVCTARSFSSIQALHSIDIRTQSDVVLLTVTETELPGWTG